MLRTTTEPATQTALVRRGAWTGTEFARFLKSKIAESSSLIGDDSAFSFAVKTVYSYPPVLLAIIATASATDSPITITVVAQATTLKRRVFTYSPINSFLLISKSINTSTKG